MTTRKWGSEFQVNTQSLGNQRQSAVTALSDGGFMVAWTDQNPAIDEIKMQRFDAQGNAVGAEFIPFDDGNGFTGLNPDLVQLTDGNIWFVTDRLDGVLYSDGEVITLDGTSVRDQYIQGLVSDVHVASLGGSGAVVVGTEAGDIKMRIYDVTGTLSPTSVPVLANTNAFGTLSALQEQPAVAANASGTSYVVTWYDGGTASGVHCRVFNSTGTEVAAEFTAGTSSGLEPSVTWIAEDRFVLAWTDFNPAAVDASSYGIYYQVYGTDGTAIGPRGLANTETHEDQSSSDIISLKGGGFAIAWTDRSTIGGDASFSAVKLQILNSLGEKRGDELLVNTTTLGLQDDVHLATLADGRIAVTWTDMSSGEVMAQIVDPRDGVVDGTSAADTLYGHDAVGDVITGFDGADTMFGLNGSDNIHGGQGADTANGGRGDDVIYGGADSDTLNGNQGDDQLFGGKGTDTLTGGKGDDEYNGGAGNDVIFDGDGADAINGGADIDKVDYLLATAGLTTSLDGTLTATGAAAGDSYISIEQLTGTNFADTLRGNALANTIFGRSGDDRIIGAGGADTLLGNAGSDTFAYASVSESGPTAKDQLTDFTFVAGNGTTFADRIDLSAIDAIAGGGTANDTFTFVGGAAFSAAGQIRVSASGASDTLVEINISGTSGAEMAILLKAILPNAIFDEDFVL